MQTIKHIRFEDNVHQKVWKAQRIKQLSQQTIEIGYVKQDLQLKMELTGNKKPYNHATAAKTNSNGDRFASQSPNQPLSFRQTPSPNPSPMRTQTFSNLKDQPHSYRVQILSHIQDQQLSHHRGQTYSHIKDQVITQRDQTYSNLKDQPQRGQSNLKDQPLTNRTTPNPSKSERPPAIYSSPLSRLPPPQPQDIDQLIFEHRVEVQTLLQQIGRLQEEVHRCHDVRALEARTVRQEYEETSFLQLSQLRQNQHAQAEVFEVQIRRLKEQLGDRSEEATRLQSQLQREREGNEAQKKRFKEEVHILIQKKNAQIFQLQQQGESKLRQFQWQKNGQLQQLRYARQKQLSNLTKLLEQREGELQKVKVVVEKEQRQKQKQIDWLQEELQAVQSRNQQRLAKQTQKYDNIRSKFNNLISEFGQTSEASRTQLQRIFQTQYSQLLALLKTKDAELRELRKQQQIATKVCRSEMQTLLEQNSHLQTRVNQLSQTAAQDMELVKVKLAALHQTDLAQLKQLYELKLKHSAGHLFRIDQENSKLRELTHLLSAEKYEMKKTYEMTISELNGRIMKMRMGMGNMEHDFKERIENEKSLMLMTSRSFLKEAEVKDHSHKFLEEELRKLRQLMDLQSRQNQNSERVVEERIQAANYQLEQLSNRVLLVAKEKKELEEELGYLRREKDDQIARLRQELQVAEQPEHNIAEQLKLIEQLREEASAKKEEIAILKDKIQALESRVKEMHAEMERLQMENNISSDQVRKEFHVVAEQHLKDFKKYYEEKVGRMEEEKTELKKIISSQYEKITELIKKYKETEEGLKEATRMMRKRTELEEKVMNIGLDCNLVKNLAQLLPHNNNQ